MDATVTDPNLAAPVPDTDAIPKSETREEMFARLQKDSASEETSQSNASAGDPEGKSQPKEEEPKGEYRPAWDRNREPQHVPLAVLKEERQKRQDLEREVAMLRAGQTLQQVQGDGRPASAIPEAQAQQHGGEDPLKYRPFAKTLDDFGGDPLKYMDARDEHNRNEWDRVNDLRMQQRQEAERGQATEQAMASEFAGRVAEAVKSNPEIQKAIDFLGLPEVAASLPVELRWAIVHDPEGPAKAHAMLSDPDVEKRVFGAPNAFQAALEFARIQVVAPAASTAMAPEVPAAPRPSLPRMGKASGGAPVDFEAMDDASFSKSIRARMERHHRR